MSDSPEGQDATGIKARLRAVKEREGVSMKVFAELCGVSWSNASRWLTGDTTVPADFLPTVVRVFGVDPGWLLTGRGAPGDVRLPKDQAERIERFLSDAVANPKEAPLAVLMARQILRTHSGSKRTLDEATIAFMAEDDDDVRAAALRHLRGSAGDESTAPPQAESGSDGED